MDLTPTRPQGGHHSGKAPCLLRQGPQVNLSVAEAGTWLSVSRPPDADAQSAGYGSLSSRARWDEFVARVRIVDSTALGVSARSAYSRGFIASAFQ